MLLTLLQSPAQTNEAQVVASIPITASILARAGKKRGGSSSGQDQVYFDLLGRAKIDQRDLLDIVTLIGFLASRIDDL
jgi:hypothetical protein